MGRRMVTAKSTVDTEKKERERRVIEAARQRSAYFPSGELCPDECPDWLIPSAWLGIEVSELLPPKPVAAKFSGPQVSLFRKR
jgi:hypothetical protein